MPSLEILLTFFVTAAIFAFIPGPAMLYAAARTMAGGRWSGLMASLGLHVGGYVHVAAAAMGLSVIFHAVPVLYMTMKLFGAAYLVWLGISMFRAAVRNSGVTMIEPKSGRRAFLESATVEILNPKTAIFYLAFLPQFTDPAASLPISLQFVMLGMIVNAMFSAADLVAVLLAGAVTHKFKQSNRVQKLLQRAGGSILVGLGIHLALQKT